MKFRYHGLQNLGIAIYDSQKTDLVDFFEEDTHLPGTNNVLALCLSRTVHPPRK